MDLLTVMWDPQSQHSNATAGLCDSRAQWGPTACMCASVKLGCKGRKRLLLTLLLLNWAESRFRSPCFKDSYSRSFPIGEWGGGKMLWAKERETKGFSFLLCLNSVSRHLWAVPCLPICDFLLTVNQPICKIGTLTFGYISNVTLLWQMSSDYFHVFIINLMRTSN